MMKMGLSSENIYKKRGDRMSNLSIILSISFIVIGSIFIYAMYVKDKNERQEKRQKEDERIWNHVQSLNDTGYKVYVEGVRREDIHMRALRMQDWHVIFDTGKREIYLNRKAVKR